jgi:hypothetical protein
MYSGSWQAARRAGRQTADRKEAAEAGLNGGPRRQVAVWRATGAGGGMESSGGGMEGSGKDSRRR